MVETIKGFCANLVLDLSNEINTIEKSNQSRLNKIQSCINICNDIVARLKRFTVKYEFQSLSEEIKFFKFLKPNITSNLEYYLCLLQIESSRPMADARIQLHFLEKHLSALNTFFLENQIFLKYYRSESTYLDEKIFVRAKAKPNINILITGCIYNLDERFNSSHDNKLSTLLAYEKLSLYIHHEMQKITSGDHKSHVTQESFTNFHWTETKVSLVELIYGLYAAKCINNGKIEISELASYFERSFNIQLGDFYRKYLEIKARKYSPTKFIDHMKDSLVSKMEEELD